VPATARAERHTGGVSPDAVAGHTAAEHRPPVAAPRATIRAERRRPRIATGRPAPVPARPAAAPPARPLTAPSRPRPDAPRPDGRPARRARTPHHRAWASRRLDGSRRVDSPPQSTFVTAHVVIRATALATGAGLSRAARTGVGPRRPPQRHPPALARRRTAPSRDREMATAVNSAGATAPVSLPVPGLPPPVGAEGFATTPGGGAAGGTAAALLALLGALLVAALLPGLLRLDLLPWRSAVVSHQLERPG
jgi:hypothetical protein